LCLVGVQHALLQRGHRRPGPQPLKESTHTLGESPALVRIERVEVFAFDVKSAKLQLDLLMEGAANVLLVGLRLARPKLDIGFMDSGCRNDVSLPPKGPDVPRQNVRLEKGARHVPKMETPIGSGHSWDKQVSSSGQLRRYSTEKRIIAHL